MTATELRELFKTHNKTQTDFIEWAAKWGVNVAATEVSRHMSKSKSVVKINKGYQLAYRVYFEVFR